MSKENISKEIKCNICSSSFSKTGNFNRHVRNVHGLKTEMKKFVQSVYLAIFLFNNFMVKCRRELHSLHNIII